MADGMLDGEGRLRLPPEVVEKLGWSPGQTLHLDVDGDALVAQPATRATSLKEDARRLASAMRDLTQGAVKSAAGAVEGIVARPGAAPGPAASASPVPTTAHTAFHGATPVVAESAYLAGGAIVIGDVRLGEDCSVWPGAVIRGDVSHVRVGARTNVQDGAVLHVSPQVPCLVGSGVTVGHQATVHACTVADDVLIGIHAVVLDGAKIESRCIIAAGAVVPPGMEIPAGKMVMGVPAKVVRDLTPQELERIHWNADSYVSLKNEYLRPTVESAPILPFIPGKAAPPARGALPRYECRRASGPIRIDGSLDEPAWAAVAPTSPFVSAIDAGPPQQPTELKVCWDDQHLYLAFSCKDTNIWAEYTDRDDPLYDEEVVECFLSPTGDLRHYFEFEISPANVLFDAKVFNPEGDRRAMLVEREWNAPGIRTAVRVSGRLNDRTSPDIGWIAEIAIPFVDLGLVGPPAPGTVWRANFYRIERGDVTEFTAWSPTYKDPADFHVPASFGELAFTE